VSVNVLTPSVSAPSTTRAECQLRSVSRSSVSSLAHVQPSGLEDLAAKVRPSGRRPGRTAAEEDDALPPEEPVSPGSPPALEGD
jgi:hypothetical protein